MYSRNRQSLKKNEKGISIGFIDATSRQLNARVRFTGGLPHSAARCSRCGPLPADDGERSERRSLSLAGRCSRVRARAGVGSWRRTRFSRKELEGSPELRNRHARRSAVDSGISKSAHSDYHESAAATSTISGQDGEHVRGGVWRRTSHRRNIAKPSLRGRTVLDLDAARRGKRMKSWVMERASSVSIPGRRSLALCTSHAAAATQVVGSRISTVPSKELRRATAFQVPEAKRRVSTGVIATASTVWHGPSAPGTA